MANYNNELQVLKHRRTKALKRAERLQAQAQEALALADDLELQIAFASAEEHRSRIEDQIREAAEAMVVRIETDYRRGGAE